MHHRLQALQPYPFERLRALLADVSPPALSPIRLSVGEPQHPAPTFVHEALTAHLDGLSHYPLTAGSERLRTAIAAWFSQRYALPSLDPGSQVLPVNGSREALFAFAQCVIDGSRPGALVGCPNPFYQIYEGAALLAGATPVFFNQTRDTGFAMDLSRLSDDDWARVQLVYVCSPGNPTGHVLTVDDWEQLFALADRHGFVIASDECYSEIYFDEDAPPVGVLQAAARLGRDDYRGLMAFTSLSKRSNLPGLRSGAMAGDASLLKAFLRYRTYHGSAMSPAVQEASIAAWGDEAHVQENRRRYREKFEAVVPRLAPVLAAPMPEAGFYLWAQVPEVWQGDDQRFARDLVATTNVTVLPGSYLARDAYGINPGAGYVRIALVADLADCLDAASRIVDACERFLPSAGAHVPTSVPVSH